MTELPQIGTPMYLVQSADTNFRSRLEAVADGTLSVTAPLETTGPDAPQPGQEIEVFWTQPRARVVLPCRLVGIAGSAPYRWTLEPLGAPKSSNRREYVRGGGGTA
ncbi:MAG TPA: PilZ domain-containing protein, partial [Actinoplanes sp.]